MYKRQLLFLYDVSCFRVESHEDCICQNTSVNSSARNTWSQCRTHNNVTFVSYYYFIALVYLCWMKIYIYFLCMCRKTWNFCCFSYLFITHCYYKSTCFLPGFLTDCPSNFYFAPFTHDLYHCTLVRLKAACLLYTSGVECAS